MLDGFDLTTIHDESLRTIVRFLMNQVEDLAAKVRHQADEIQRLRDENNRLKGEHGQPTIKPNRPALACSSTHERAIPQARCTRAKQATLRIDRTETLMVDRATLPHDARFKGYHQVRVQDLRLTTDTVCFRKEKWYSPSLRQTFLAANPPGYEGQFGPHLKAFVLTLAFESGHERTQYSAGAHPRRDLHLSRATLAVNYHEPQCLSPRPNGHSQGWICQQSVAAY